MAEGDRHLSASASLSLSLADGWHARDDHLEKNGEAIDSFVMFCCVLNCHEHFWMVLGLCIYRVIYIKLDRSLLLCICEVCKFYNSCKDSMADLLVEFGMRYVCGREFTSKKECLSAFQGSNRIWSKLVLIASFGFRSGRMMMDHPIQRIC
ncbi:unnamed protein product [Urochloa humidicola]